MFMKSLSITLMVLERVMRIMCAMATSASVMAGSQTPGSRFHRLSLAPATVMAGNHGSQMAKARVSRVALMNSGTVMAISTRLERLESIQLSRLSAAISPSRMASGMAITVAMPPSSKVLARRGIRVSLTGARLVSEVPKSPLNNCPHQLTKRVVTGVSKPSSARHWARLIGVMLRPR